MEYGEAQLERSTLPVRVQPVLERVRRTQLHANVQMGDVRGGARAAGDGGRRPATNRN